MPTPNPTAIEATWNIKLPSQFGPLDEIPWNVLRLPDGQVFRPPWPPLSNQEIVAAHKVAADWQIPPGLVPVMGDFHDLLCLDYRGRSAPAVVYLNDERSIRVLFNDYESFLASRSQVPETETDISGIIERESWLDF